MRALALAIVLGCLRVAGLLAQHSPMLAIVLGFTVGLIPGGARFLGLADSVPLRVLVTVTVSADGKNYRGTAIQEINTVAEVRSLPGNGGGVGVGHDGHGQAVVVDIPDRPSLFFLVNGVNGRWAEEMMIACKINSDDSNPIRRLDVVRNFHGPCIMRGGFRPAIVRFANEADATTVELVKPPEFGGVDGDLEVVEVMVQRTDKPVNTRSSVDYPGSCTTVGQTYGSRQ